MAKAKSGKYWVAWAKTHAKNSTSLADLETSFQNKVTKFKQALEAAGATVNIDATRRSKKRAYLFHWCWKLSQGRCKAKDIPAMIGVDIDWDHDTEDSSISAAKEMAAGFGLAMPPRSTNPPALTSNHICRRSRRHDHHLEGQGHGSEKGWREGGGDFHAKCQCELGFTRSRPFLRCDKIKN